MLLLHNVCKKYNDDYKNNFELSNINLQFNDCGLYFILGKSGCGKTTLLNLMGLMDNVDSGFICFNDKIVSEQNKAVEDYYRNFIISYVFQDFNLIGDYNVYENLEIASELQGKKQCKSKIEECLKKVGLEDYLYRKLSTLSGGEKQRVAIARSLIKDSKVLLCDEPTGSLDKTNSLIVFNILKEISKTKLVIVVTHDQDMAYKFGDHILKMSDGKIENSSSVSASINPVRPKKKKTRINFKTLFKLSFKNFRVNFKKFVLSVLSFTASLSICSICFSFMGIDKKKIALESIQENNGKSIQVLKYSYDKNGTGYQENIDDYDVEFLNDYLKIDSSRTLFNYTFSYKTSFVKPYLFEGKKRNPNAISYTKNIFGINEKILNDFDFKILEGELPVNDNEIAISDFIAYEFLNYGFKNSEISIDNPTYKDLIGKKINLIDDKGNGLDFILKGIIETCDSKKAIRNPYIDFNETPIVNYNKENQWFFTTTLFLNSTVVDEKYKSKEVYSCIAIPIKEINDLSLIQNLETNLKHNHYCSHSFLDEESFEYAGFSPISQEMVIVQQFIQNTLGYAVLLGILSFFFEFIAILFSIMLFNDLVNSQKRKIAILKTLGMADRQITFIYIFEVMALALVSIVASLGGALLITGILNALISELLLLNIAILKFTFVNALLIGGLILFGAVIGFSISITKILSKKPIQILKK